MTTSMQTIRLIGYLIISLLFGIVITAIVGSIGNSVIEKNVRRDTKTQIRNAVKSFEDASLEYSTEEVRSFLEEYLNTVMKDMVVVVDRSKGNKIPRQDEASFLFSFTEQGGQMDIYIKQSFVKDEMFELDQPLLIEGVVATLVMFTLLVVFLEQRRQVQLKHQSETAALNRALEEQHALVLLGRMSATLTHELKTPIATLSNLVYALPSHIADPHFAARFVVLAKEEIGRTQQLIDNLLSYGKDITITSEEWISLPDFAGPMADKAGLGLDCPRVQLFADRFYLGLLFENLMSNSAQAEAKKITVKMHMKKEVAEIHYKDDGKGFPLDIRLDELAKPFVTFRARGAGLGLYLVNKILAAHGGGISFHRSLNGASIRISLPSERCRTHDQNPA